MGGRNSPKPCLTPKDSANINALPNKTQPLLRHTVVIIILRERVKTLL
jgi:hypothetical protein